MIPFMVGKLAPNRNSITSVSAYLQPVGFYVKPQPKDARDENPGKVLILPSAPPLLSPF